MRDYPVDHASSARATGNLFYDFLLDNIKVPASATHTLWYNGVQDQLKNPDKSAFRGDIPVGQTMKLVSLDGQPFEKETDSISDIVAWTFTGDEQFVLVKDLAEETKSQLGIPENAKTGEKVFNYNFKKYDNLPQMTKYSNELAPLSVINAISSYLAGVQGKVTYNEKDVLEFLSNSMSDLSSEEMTHILGYNNMAWKALAYIRGEGNLEGDMRAEFYGQNPADFYAKDLGTVLPAIYFALASLGENPVQYDKKLDISVWGSTDVAKFMMDYMPEETKKIRAV